MTFNFKLFGTTSAIALFAFGAVAQADTVVRVLRAATGNEVQTALYETMAAEYEAANPGIDVQIEFIDNESFKQKLPTMLQSDERPDIFYSWGGGVLQEQAEAGFLEDITATVTGEWAAEYSAAGVAAFTVDGKIVGVPTSASDVGFWANRDLAAKAGIDLDAIKTWADFLAAVDAAKAAGITPIVAGGKDKWPLHFYLGYLSVRIAGKDGFAAAMAGEGDGFAAPAFLEAANQFKALVDKEAFQNGFMDTDYGTASGMFGDGKAVFHLMGDWDYGASRGQSASGQGLSDAQLALVRFPAVEGGAGAATDTFGGINGWAVAKGASPEALNFLRWMNGRENQSREAGQGFYIPVAIGADTAVVNPFFQQISASLAASQFHQIFLDQALGADVGATFNDASADLASGAISPEDAVAAIQEAWSFK
jgi:raffinose/stachyose/melibiose transport system substrate-binding protein